MNDGPNRNASSAKMNLCEVCSPVIGDRRLRAVYEQARALSALPDYQHTVTIKEWHFSLSSLGTVVAKQTACPFCNFIVRSLKAKYPQDEPETWLAMDQTVGGFAMFSKRPGAGFEIKLNFIRKGFSWSSVVNSWSPEEEVNLDELINSVPPELSNPPDLRFAICSSLWMPRKEQGPTWSSREGGLLDLERLQLWWRSCQTNHQQCRPATWTPKSLGLELRVVDVHRYRVIIAPPGCKYVALSYRWGNSKAIDIEDASFQGPRRRDTGGLSGRSFFPLNIKKIPRTILDAMQLVSDLGGQYLWVDTLCAPQGNPDARQKLVSHMDLVYMHAAITLCCAGKDNAHHPLPGLSEDTRNRVVVQEEIEGNQLRLAPSDFLEQIESSPWSTRGWTYQEEYFGARKLVLTDNAVFYKCQAGLESEDIISPAEQNPSSPLQDLEEIWATPADTVIQHLDNSVTESLAERRLDRQLPAAIIGNSGLGPYCTHVERYTMRELTHPWDVENALAGVLHMLKAGHGSVFIWTLPREGFATALLWEPAPLSKRPVRRREISAGNAPISAKALCPASDIPKDGTLLAGAFPFPSWSWAGWTGPVVYALDTRYGIIESDIVWPWAQPMECRAAYMALFENGILQFDAEVADLRSLPSEQLGMVENGGAELGAETESVNRRVVRLAMRTGMLGTREVASVIAVEGTDGVLFREGMRFDKENLWTAAQRERRTVRLR